MNDARSPGACCGNAYNERVYTMQVQTPAHDAWVEITERVAERIRAAAFDAGAILVYVPHTTAGVTLNENADPDVVADMRRQLASMVPWTQPFYAHGEGNSAAHVKASMMGHSVTVPVSGGRMALGTWQGIHLCEFDGPRQRRVCLCPLAAAPPG